MPTQHDLQHDWKTARANLARTKANALADCLDHLNDVGEILDSEPQKVEYTQAIGDTRNLIARLRSIKGDYESDAGIQ